MTETFCSKTDCMEYQDVVRGDVFDHRLLQGCNINLENLTEIKSITLRLYVFFTKDVVELKRAIEREEFPRLMNHCRQNYGLELQVVDLLLDHDVEPSLREFSLSLLRSCHQKAQIHHLLFAGLIGSEVFEEPFFDRLIEILLDIQRDPTVLNERYRVVQKTSNNPEDALLRLKRNDSNVGLHDVKLQIEARHIQHAGQQSENEAPIIELQRSTDSKSDKEGRRAATLKSSNEEASNGKGGKWNSMSEIDNTNGDQCHTWKLPMLVTNSETRLLLKLDDHQYAREFYDSVKRLIDDQVRKSDLDDLEREVLNNWNKAKELSRGFAEQEATLRTIREYILGETVQPLVLEGEPGQGVSAVVARAVVDASEYLGHRNLRIQSTLMVRFCGRTYDSRRCGRLIFSLAQQFLRVTRKAHVVFSSWHQEARQLMREILRNGSYEGLLVIFVDAVDQLDSAEDVEDFLNWLPSRLANNTKVVVSCTTDSRAANRLRQKVTNQANIVQLGRLSADQCFHLVSSHILHSGRKMTEEQWTWVKQTLNGYQSPLYVHLLLDQINQRDSFSQKTLDQTLENCALNKFQTLEKNCGKLLTSTVLGLLVVEPGGLSDCEIEGLLPLNDDVLGKFIGSGSTPRASKRPTIAWLRLRSELSVYLEEGDHAGSKVVRFSHRTLARIAEQLYLNSSSSKISVHCQIADYFKSAASEQRPVHIEQECSQSNITEALAFFRCPHGKQRPNYRKLDLLPFHLYRSGKLKELYELVYFNFEWIFAKLHARSVKELLVDYQMVKDSEVLLVAEALAMSEQTLTRRPQLLGVELSGRLLDYYPSHHNIRSLIDQCDRWTMTVCPLVPYKAVFAAAGQTLRKIIRCSFSNPQNFLGLSVVENQDGVLLYHKPASEQRMRVWNVTSCERQSDVVTTSGSEVFPSPDGKFANVFRGNVLRIYHVESGDLYAEVDYGVGNVNSTTSVGKYFAFSFDQAPGPVVVDLEDGFLLRRFDYRCSALAISDDHKYFACNSGEILALHALPLFDRKATIELSAITEKLEFSRGNIGSVKVFALLGDRSLQAISFKTTARTATKKTLFCDFELKDFRLSHNNRRILARLSKSLYLLDPSREKSEQRLEMDSHHIELLEQSLEYQEAAFSADDRLILASRGSYLVIWDAITAQLLRLLSSPGAPIVRMLSLASGNTVLTVGADQLLSVWDLNRLQSPAQHDNCILRREVNLLAVSQTGNRFICAGKGTSVLALGSPDYNHFEYLSDPALRSSGFVNVVEYVNISATGKYAVTRLTLKRTTKNQEEENACRQTEDVLWKWDDTDSPIYRVPNSAEVVFSSDESKVAFFVRQDKDINKSSSENLENKIIILDLDKCTRHPKKDIFLETPVENLVEKVVFVEGSSYLVFICRSSGFGDQLGMYSFDRKWQGLRFKRAETLIDEFQANTDNVIMSDVRSTKEAFVLTVVETEKPGSKNNYSQSSGRIAVLFDIGTESLLLRIDPFLLPSSEVKTTLISQSSTTFIDDKNNIFKLVNCSTSGVASTRHVTRLDLNIRSICLVMDGRYAVAIVDDGEEIVLVRTEDGKEEVRIETHTRAGVVCSADRKVFLGCEDGRIMTFVVILDESDPELCILRKLPSRR